MHTSIAKRTGTYLLAGVLALAGCQGEKGPEGMPGATGPTGPSGAQGDPGVSVGTLSGVVKSTAGDTLQGITVTLDPLGLTAQTGATGAYSIANVPAGVYAVTFAGANVAAKTMPGVAMIAGQTITKNADLVYSPIKIAFAPAPAFPVGYGQDVNVSATVTGATGTLTYTWTVTGPTAATVTPNAAAASFRTGTASEMLAGGKVQFWKLPANKGLVAVTAGQTAYMNYVAKLAVTDGKYTQEATVTVPSSMFTSGAKTAPVGVPVIVNDTTATFDWKLTAPATSKAALNLATDKNAWFIPDVPGVYTVKNGDADTAPIVVDVASWNGANPDCGGCHNATIAANVAAKFKDWTNSAHGNHWWKYMQYDASGALVWTDPTVLAPTASVDAKGNVIYWTAPGRMTLPQYGLSNGEGAHYGESCIQCHAVGFNKAVANGGFDDQTGYVFPGDKLHDTGDLTKPDPAGWNAIPQGSRDLAGIQCESCHGPLGRHAIGQATAANKPASFFDGETCGVCHDRAPKHDRYQLWSNGLHSSRVLFEEGEGLGANCGRCHTAQGFVAWSKQGFDPAFQLAAADQASAADAQPVTCVACHDPHTTTLRVDVNKAQAITSGFTVAGAGAGQLCVICHSSRRGLRNDTVTLTASNAYSLPHAAAQADLFFGQNAFFMGALNDGLTVSTHAYVVEGTCVGCHMEPELGSESVTIAGTAGAIGQVTNHSFKVAANVCGKCHEGAALEALKTSVEGKLAELQTIWAAKAKSALPATFVINLTATNTTPAPGTVGAATFTTAPDTVTFGAAGQHSMAITLHWNAPIDVTIGGATVTLGDATNGVTVGVALSSVLAADGTTAVYGPNSDLVKATWNIGLIEEERSFGAHNPGFTQQVLGVTKTKLNALP